MAVASISHPITIAETFSFYVSSSELRALQVRSELPDAVTVNGPNGPAIVSSMRIGGWDCPVIFDRSGYNPKIPPIDPERWFDDQASWCRSNIDGGYLGAVGSNGGCAQARRRGRSKTHKQPLRRHSRACGRLSVAHKDANGPSCGTRRAGSSCRTGALAPK